MNPADNSQKPLNNPQSNVNEGQSSVPNIPESPFADNPRPLLTTEEVPTTPTVEDNTQIVSTAPEVPSSSLTPESPLEKPNQQPISTEPPPNNPFQSNKTKKVAAGLMGVLFLVGATVAGVILVRQRQNISEKAAGTQTIECPILAADNKIVVKFASGYIRSDKEESDAKQSPTTTFIPAGNYKVTLVSYEEDHPESDSQPKESWFVKLNNSQGATFMQTGAIEDLPDAESVKTQEVNNSLTLSQDATSILPYHAAYKDTTNTNSITPVCAAFEKIADQSASEPKPAVCKIYAVHDKDGADTQFLSIDPSNNYSVTPLGKLYEKYNIESLDVHPNTKILYALGAEGSNGIKPGVLFKVDAETGQLKEIGKISHSAPNLSFRSTDATLWSWAPSAGLIRIDYQNATSTVVYANTDHNFGGITWSNDGKILYLAQGSNLYTFNPDTNSLTKIASNLPGSERTEALEMSPDGTLVGGFHNANQSISIFAYDIAAKKPLADKNIPTPYNDIEGIAWPESCGDIPIETQISCGAVQAYDTNWNKLSSDQLKTLKAGDKIRFAVEGTASTGSFDKAKFKINGQDRTEVSSKRPGTNEFYDEYTIPAGVSTFTVSGQVHHIEKNKWY